MSDHAEVDLKVVKSWLDDADIRLVELLGLRKV